MAFKLVSKNNIGIFTTLILVILLSQSRFFNLLTDTPLGRMVLLAFVIFIAYSNQILGLIAVLCIIITFNNNVNIVSGYNLYEGLKNPKKLKKSRNDEDDDDEDDDDELKKKKSKKSKWNTGISSINNISRSANAAQNRITGSTVSASREGFCMADREINMLRGKQSNAISVSNNLREQSDDVSPSDKSIFTSDYETFL